MMRLILKEDVANLGKSGEIVNVRDGYGRNFLLPKQLAVRASVGNVRQLEHQKRLVEIHRKKVTDQSMASKAAIEAVRVVIHRAVGEEDRLFGSVTSRDIVDALAAQGVVVDRKHLDLDEPIKAIGEHEVEVKLPQGVRATVKVSVVPKED